MTTEDYLRYRLNRRKRPCDRAAAHAQDGKRDCVYQNPRTATVMREKELPYRYYPVTHLCWNRVRGSCHGESPLTEAIPNQIAINKLYSMYVQCIKQVPSPRSSTT